MTTELSLPRNRKDQRQIRFPHLATKDENGVAVEAKHPADRIPLPRRLLQRETCALVNSKLMHTVCDRQQLGPEYQASQFGGFPMEDSETGIQVAQSLSATDRLSNARDVLDDHQIAAWFRDRAVSTRKQIATLSLRERQIVLLFAHAI